MLIINTKILLHGLLRAQRNTQTTIINLLGVYKEGKPINIKHILEQSILWK